VLNLDQVAIDRQTSDWYAVCGQPSGFDIEDGMEFERFSCGLVIATFRRLHFARTQSLDPLTFAHRLHHDLGHADQRYDLVMMQGSVRGQFGPVTRLTYACRCREQKMGRYRGACWPDGMTRGHR